MLKISAALNGPLVPRNLVCSMEGLGVSRSDPATCTRSVTLHQLDPSTHIKGNHKRVLPMPCPHQCGYTKSDENVRYPYTSTRNKTTNLLHTIEVTHLPFSQPISLCLNDILLLSCGSLPRVSLAQNSYAVFLSDTPYIFFRLC